MYLYLLIALGSALGGAARFGVSELVATRFDGAFPWGTLAVNVLGCFAIGFFAALTHAAGRMPLSPECRQFFMVGFCGGFTTFSAVSLQTLELARSGALWHAGANAAGSIVVCMIAVWLGYLAATGINPATN